MSFIICGELEDKMDKIEKDWQFKLMNCLKYWMKKWSESSSTMSWINQRLGEIESNIWGRNEKTGKR